MGKTHIQKLESKFNKGLIGLPLNVRLKCDRFNYSVGKLKLRRNKIKEKILNKEFNNEININNMKYKVGDKVKIKSLDWFNNSARTHYGSIDCGSDSFTNYMSEYCGMEAIVIDINSKGKYLIDIDNKKWNWTDEMFE